MDKETEQNGLGTLADILIHELMRCGFTVQRYDAMSSFSIYLKLDYGMCNSIRISNHRGKAYLKYRYNIGTDVQIMKKVHDGYDRYYYPACRTEELVDQIVLDRCEKLKTYGFRYYDMMQQNKLSNEGKKGFWSKAVVITEDPLKGKPNPPKIKNPNPPKKRKKKYKNKSGKRSNVNGKNGH